jgi:hypothetical protein
MGQKKKVEPEDPPGFMQRLTRFWVTTLVILLILYVASFFIVRTEGFRYMVAERVSERSGWTVTIEKSWLNPNGSIVFVNVQTEAFEPGGTTGASIGELQLSFSLLGGLLPGRPLLAELRIQNATLSYDFRAVPDRVLPFEADAWLLAGWLGVTRSRPRELPEPQLLDGRREMRLQNVDLIWWHPERQVLMQSLQGVQLRTESARVLDRVVWLRDVSAKAVFSEGLTQANIQRRALLLDGEELVPLTSLPDRQ